MSPASAIPAPARPARKQQRDRALMVDDAGVPLPPHRQLTDADRERAKRTGEATRNKILEVQARGRAFHAEQERKAGEASR